MRNNNGVGALLEPWLHKWLVFKHVQPALEVRIGFQVRDECFLVDDGAARRVDEDCVVLHHLELLGVDEVVRVLVEVAVKADDVGGLENALDGLRARHPDGPLALRLEELAVSCHVVLEELGGVRVVVDDVHLVALDHHPGVGGADAARADDAHRLVLEEIADKEGREPALVVARPHKDVGLDDAAGGRQRQRRGELGCGLCQNTWRVAHSDAVSRRSRHFHVVVANGVVAVHLPARGFECTKQLMRPVLSELSDNTIALVPNQLFNS
mmetsp:Transcript_6856/g.16586  ORF Transcript_6856/g.16586 Transcript_6856/m.16586 type:complete len:268 (-) Transcript_6856:362-1165(-)